MTWRLPFGANLLVDEKHAQFRIWAPDQKALALAIEGRAPTPMATSSDGWFAVIANCGAGTRYRYLLQDGTAVPDPASRLQDDDVDGHSVVVDPASYQWRNQQWRGRPWTETVLYELHVGLLDGFEGVKRELARLADLGVTAIELMPIAEFPGARNWGYDSVLPFAPERSYGTPDQLKALIDEAHGLGLMMFLDVVYNHFGPDGNYLPLYASAMFREDIATPWGPAIDFRRPEVRRYFTENALYWLLEYRFDGLRFDAVHTITPREWLDEMAGQARACISDREVHLVLENDDNTASHLASGFNAQWNDDGHHVLHRLLTGEHQGYYEDYNRPAARLARCLKEGFVYQGEASAHRGGKRRGTPSTKLSPSAFVLFLQNHDQIGNRAFGERLTSLAKPAALEAAIALQLLCPQIPLIFMGEETRSEAPFLFFTDHNEKLAEAVRAGRRREFASFPQFADTTLLKQIPDPNEEKTFERSQPFNDRASGQKRKDFYRHLLDLRRTYIIPRLTGARAVDAKAVGEAAVVAGWRLGDGSTLMIACNLAADAVEIEPLASDILFATSDEALNSCRVGRLEAHTTIAQLHSL
jgi:maltooligosyltrehalose trehalohydrolase